MITISRRFEWDAAHRVLGHQGKCRFLHGHRYAAEVVVTAPELDQLSMVTDFSILKSLIGDFINNSWDHNILLSGKDPQLLHLFETEERDPYVFSANPTAEVIAKELFIHSRALLSDSQIQVVSVKVWETPNCYAIYEETDVQSPAG